MPLRFELVYSWLYDILVIELCITSFFESEVGSFHIDSFRDPLLDVIEVWLWLDV